MKKHINIGTYKTDANENNLIGFRQKQQVKFTQIKRIHISPNSNENFQKWSRNTILIVGDSMLSEIEERRISKRVRKIKVISFTGATIDEMYDYIKPLLKKCS